LTSWPPHAPRVPLHSPSRHTIGGHPGLLHPDGSTIPAIVPFLHFDLNPEGLVRVSGYFIVHGSTSRFFEIQIEESEVLTLLHEWRSCPEVVMVEKFGWWPESRPPKVQDLNPKPSRKLQELSLDDLEDLL
jgi:hypothetical protein